MNSCINTAGKIGRRHFLLRQTSPRSHMDDQTWQDLRFVLVPPKTSIEDLPICLVADILSHLPVKTLIRSTCVSTTWYNLIRNSKFINMHLHRSISAANKCNENYLVVVPSASRTPSCSLISDLTYKEDTRFEVPFRTASGLVRIYSSCDGLICLGDGSLISHGRLFYIWNPMLKRYRYIDNSAYPELLCDFVKNHCVIGFGFNDFDNDYKILRIFFHADSLRNYFGLKPSVEIYSLKSDSWRKLECNVPHLLHHAKWIYVDGFLYFLEYKTDGTEEWVVLFDLKKEVFKKIKFPEKFRSRAGENVKVTLQKFKGSVSICGHESVPRPCIYSIWVLKKYTEGLYSWREEIRTVSKCVGIPFMFTSTGYLVLEAVGLSTLLGRLAELPNLVVCDLDKKKFRHIGSDGPYTGDVSFVESLVLLGDGESLVKRCELVDVRF